MANFNYNRVQLGGRLVGDVKTMTTNSGMEMCNFTVAISRRSKNNTDAADFVSCRAFDKTAKMIAQYFHKGSSIMVEGHIQTGNYVDKNNQKVYTTDVMVDNVYFVDSKNDNAQQTAPQPDNSANYIPDAYKQANVSKDSSAGSGSSLAFEPVTEDDGDLPF